MYRIGNGFCFNLSVSLPLNGLNGDFYFILKDVNKRFENDFLCAKLTILMVTSSENDLEKRKINHLKSVYPID